MGIWIFFSVFHSDDEDDEKKLECQQTKNNNNNDNGPEIRMRNIPTTKYIAHCTDISIFGCTSLTHHWSGVVRRCGEKMYEI